MKMVNNQTVKLDIKNKAVSNESIKKNKVQSLEHKKWDMRMVQAFDPELEAFEDKICFHYGQKISENAYYTYSLRELRDVYKPLWDEASRSEIFNSKAFEDMLSKNKLPPLDELKSKILEYLNSEPDKEDDTIDISLTSTKGASPEESRFFKVITNLIKTEKLKPNTTESINQITSATIKTAWDMIYPEVTMSPKQINIQMESMGFVWKVGHGNKKYLQNEDTNGNKFIDNYNRWKAIINNTKEVEHEKLTITIPNEVRTAFLMVGTKVITINIERELC